MDCELQEFGDGQQGDGSGDDGQQVEWGFQHQQQDQGD